MNNIVYPVLFTSFNQIPYGYSWKLRYLQIRLYDTEEEGWHIRSWIVYRYDLSHRTLSKIRCKDNNYSLTWYLQIIFMCIFHWGFNNVIHFVDVLYVFVIIPAVVLITNTWFDICEPDPVLHPYSSILSPEKS